MTAKKREERDQVMVGFRTWHCQFCKLAWPDATLKLLDERHFDKHGMCRLRTFEVGDLVYYKYKLWYGVIIRRKQLWRDIIQREQPRFDVCPINIDTGLPMQCPDDRCKGEDPTCPICNKGAWLDELEPFSQRDMEFYAQEGLIHTSLVKEAK